MKMCLGLKKRADRWTEELELLSFVLVFFSIPLRPLHSISLHSTPLQLDSFLLILSFFFLLSSFFFFDSELWGTYLPTPDPPEKDLCQAIVWHDSAKLFDVNFCGHQQNFLTSKNFQTIQTFQLSDCQKFQNYTFLAVLLYIWLCMHWWTNDGKVLPPVVLLFIWLSMHWSWHVLAQAAYALTGSPHISHTHWLLWLFCIGCFALFWWTPAQCFNCVQKSLHILLSLIQSWQVSKRNLCKVFPPLLCPCRAGEEKLYRNFWERCENSTAPVVGGFLCHMLWSFGASIGGCNSDCWVSSRRISQWCVAFGNRIRNLACKSIVDKLES